MPTHPESALGERARAARTRLGLNQLEVAERIGISSEAYGRLERGLMAPRFATFLRLCDVLGVEPNDLLLASPGPLLRNDAMSPELRQLVAVLEHADAVVIKRVTDVARWLLAGPAPRKASSSSGKRKAVTRVHIAGADAAEHGYSVVVRALLFIVLLAACGDNTLSPLCPVEAPRGTAPAPLEDVRFVAHAFGSPWGLMQLDHYSESREAFEVSYRNGFRAYEIDLLLLADGSVAALHDKAEKEYGLEKPFTQATRPELESVLWNGKYRVLFGEDLIDLLVTHPDIWLILDTKCCHEAIAKKLVELAPDNTVRDRIVPHVTGPVHASALPRIYPFPEQLYARYWWGGTDTEVLARLEAFHIDNVMMWWDSNWSEPLQAAADERGLHVWVHTPSDPDTIKDFVARGVGTYTDGYITCGSF